MHEKRALCTSFEITLLAVYALNAASQFYYQENAQIPSCFIAPLLLAVAQHSKMYVAVNVGITAGVSVSLSLSLSPRLVRGVVKKPFVVLCSINHLQALRKFV